MGRSSSTGFPYLVGRADAGQFTYQRTVPDHLNGLVVGDVRLAWAGRTRDLRGTTTIKISLSTGDLATARQRWAAIHPQVDALVQLAEVRARTATKPNAPASVPRLDPAQVRTIAGQVYHDVLATDDRGQVEPGFVTPVAGIILNLVGRRHAGDPDRVKIAELAARKINEGIHRGRLRRRDTAILDEQIEVSKLDANVLESLPLGFKPGDRLAPEQVEALAQGGIEVGIDPVSWTVSGLVRVGSS